MTTSIIKYLLTATLFISAYALNAQEASATANNSKGKYETIEMKVKGVCGMCQSRIELAVYDLKGVKSAKWDLDTDMLTAVVKKGKVSKKDIAEALSKAGHSNELKKADPEAYAELPGCCKYDDGVQKHGDGHK